MSKPRDIGSPITKVIKEIREQTEAGLEKWELKSPVDLELSTIIGKEGGGNLAIQVLTLGAKAKSEEIQKIRLSIGPKEKALEAEREGKIAEAEAKMAIAKKMKREPWVK